MKHRVAKLLILALCFAPLRMSAGSPVEARGAGGARVINTTTLCPEVKGMIGPVPLLVTVKGGKIESVRPLANKETPKYFRMLTDAGFFSKWNGMTLKKASSAEIDAVTGATYSSKAVIANVRAAARYASGSGKRK